MTEDKGEADVLEAIKTTPGNFCKDHYNQRQIDVIKEEILPKYSEDEIAKQKKFRRSITTANALKAGQEITYNDILFKRPGTGIPANKYKEIIGRHVNRDIEENKTLFWEDLVK